MKDRNAKREVVTQYSFHSLGSGFQISYSLLSIYHLSLLEHDVRRLSEEGWVKLPLLCRLNN